MTVRYPLGAVKYEGQFYPIHVPDHLNTFPTAEQWTTIKVIPNHSEPEFSLLSFFAGIELDDDILGSNAVYPGDRLDLPAIQSSTTSIPLGLGALFVGILNTVMENINVYFIKFTFQTSNLGNRRVIISVGCTQDAQILEHYADGVARSALAQNAGDALTQGTINAAIADLYEQITGNPQSLNPFETYDFQVRVDQNHRNDGGASSYLWLDENGVIMEAPIIYPCDLVELGTSIANFFAFTPFYTVPLGGSRSALPQYQTLFGSIS